MYMASSGATWEPPHVRPKVFQILKAEVIFALTKNNPNRRLYKCVSTNCVGAVITPLLRLLR